MGVKDLWSILHPAVSTESLSQLAMRGFEANTGGYRGYRVGIDLSIWLGHMKALQKHPKYGKYAGTRMLFFRLARLLTIPILPLFVFDGLQRPNYKRGKDRKYSHANIEGLYKLIEAFGFECHHAPGEAEAELAHLNQIGAIDAIWTDDGDVFLFGALTVMRNPSSTLISNRSHPVINSDGEQDNHHVHVYRSSNLLADTTIELDRDGLILVALLRGGDYHKGVEGVGIKIAHALARCGFGQSLAAAVQSLQADEDSKAIMQWRSDIVQELCTDSHGQLGRRHQKLAAGFPQDFPDLQVYRAYAHPITSHTENQDVHIDWYRPLDVAALAGLCEQYFNWAGSGKLLERFRSQIWHGALCRALRQRVLETDDTGALVRPSAPGLENLVVQIHGSRIHTSTDKLRELRVEMAPGQLADIARRGASGLRIPSPRTTQARESTAHLRTPPSLPLRVWIPVTLLQAALPELVRDFEAIESNTQRQKRTTRARRTGSESTTSEDDMPPRKAARTESHTTPGARRAHRQAQSPKKSGVLPHTRASTSTRQAEVIEVSSDDDDEVQLVSKNWSRDDDVIVISSSDDD